MKKFIASASLAALGAASVQADYAPGLTPQEKTKAWSISGVLRGFYDDNPTASIKADKQESWGIQLSPSLAVNLALDQTLIGFNYTYDLRWYEARQNDSADHSHRVNFKLNHIITERYKLDVSDTFNYAQEADLQGIVSNPTGTLRNELSYSHNNARLAFTAELTPVLALVAEYQNDFWDYQQRGDGSLSAALDRIEHLGTITARWQAMPNTVGLLSYSYGVIDHTSDDSLYPYAQIDPEIRDARSHFISVGAEQTFTSQLSGQARLGAQFTDYPNALAFQDDSVVSPYADASATWTYNPGSYLQLGIRHQRNQTDVVAGVTPLGIGTTPVQDQESTGVYGVVNHRIAPNVTGSLLGQVQHSTFRGGGLDGKVDILGAVGVNLAYQVNAFVTAEAGYNYDRLDSDLVGRSFTRNRVYFGLRATY